MSEYSRGNIHPKTYLTIVLVACALATLWSILQASTATAAGRTAYAGTNASGLPATADGSTCEAAWRVVPSPNQGSGSNYLTAISAVSPSDIWAVGYYTSTGQYRTLTEHWNGTQWSIIPSPDPGYNNYLQGVAAIAHNDVWAVGSYDYPSSGGRHVLTMHWNGTQWSVVANPNPGGNYTNFLNAVDAVSSGDVWAVGFWRRYSPQGLVMRWNGTAWVQSANPSSGSVESMSAVTALSSNDVWAVGYSSTGNSLIWHWDGTQWSAVTSPNVGILHGLDASAPDDVWAIGGNDILNWDGTQWSVVPAPSVGTLNGITALSTNDAWAVGNNGTLHWDGAQWSVVPGPGVGVLKAVRALAPQDVWAVGTYPDGNVTRTLIAK
ncbi:MAG TPA: hypothetical protein VFG99_01540 [Chloroflexia bacterium]|nr:hypothetical protein [Chloroflexia bacterium]